MPRRSAPFVVPENLTLDFGSSDENILTSMDVASSHTNDSDSNKSSTDTQSNDKLLKRRAKALLSELQGQISAFRDDQFPPDVLRQVRDMPIYEGNLKEVQAYHQRWQPLIDQALLFYPSAYKPPENLPLPASLEIPQFIYHVQRLHLTKTRAKESKSFGSVGALIDKCGEFSDSEYDRLEKVFAFDDTARLVAHREFIDLRAYVFCRDNKGELLDPERIRFYRTGLIIHTLPDFKIVDSRQKPRKRRNDAYNNPLADNGVWKVYKKR